MGSPSGPATTRRPRSSATRRGTLNRDFAKLSPPTIAFPRRLPETRQMRVIDVEHLGREHVIGCGEVDGSLVDPGPESSLETLLGKLGEEPPRAVVLTHIHLDHA